MSTITAQAALDNMTGNNSAELPTARQALDKETGKGFAHAVFVLATLQYGNADYAALRTTLTHIAQADASGIASAPVGRVWLIACRLLEAVAMKDLHFPEWRLKLQQAKVLYLTALEDGDVDDEFLEPFLRGLEDSYLDTKGS